MKTQKNIALTAIALATLSLGISSAYAEDSANTGAPAPSGEVKPDESKQERFEKRGKEMFEKTDTNKDGFLSKDEMEASQRARMEEMFEKTDSDKDGKLSPEELKKGREAMRDKFREKYKEHRGKMEGRGEEGHDGPPPREDDRNGGPPPEDDKKPE